MILQLNEVSIESTRKRLVSEVKIDVNSFGVYMICGKNGSGKTTIANHLFIKYPQLIAIMLQENDLIFKEETILDNIDMYQEKKNEIINILNMFDLQYLLQKNPKYLSGGEKRVISILRVLLSDKRIIILDEPSNDIDYIMFNKIYELIQFFSKEKAVIIISHDDRFDIYIKKYMIQDKQFCLIEDRGIINKFPNNIPNKKMKELKTRKRNPIFYLFLLASLGLLFFSFKNGFNLKVLEPYTKFEQATYHIMSPIGINSQEFNGNDSLNTSLIQAAMKWNKNEYLKEVNKNMGRIEIGLEFKEDSIKHIYPIQYYNNEKKLYTDVTGKMGEIIYSGNKMVVEFQTTLSDYINDRVKNQPKAILPKTVDPEIIDLVKGYGYSIDFNEQTNDVIRLDFNEKLYNDTLEKINTSENILIEAIVKINDKMNFMDFIIVNKLNQHPFFIQGYDLYVLRNEINNYSQWILIIRSLVLYFILIAALLWITVNIYEQSNCKKYQILHYYGFDLPMIERHRKVYYLLKNYNIIVAIGCLISGIVVFLISRSYIVLIISLIYISMINLFFNFILINVKRKIRRLVK